MLTDRAWQRRMLRHAGAIHFTTAAEAELARDVTEGAPQWIVPNGIDLTRFQRAGDGLRFRAQQLGGYQGPIVLFVGRVAQKKGIDILMRSFAVAIEDDDARLVIAGPDDEGLTGELRVLAGTLGISDRVAFVGGIYGDEHLDALAAADIWALTSHTENFGNAVVEAMAAGRAVLISSEVNLADDVARSAAGVVTGLGVEEVAARLRELMDDGGFRRTLELRARRFAAQFDWASVAPRLVEMFEHTVARHTGARSDRR